MEEKNAALKEGHDGANDTVVENNDSIATENQEEVVIDYAKELQDSLQREEKLKEERDNYKKGMLLAKGKLKSEENTDEEANIEDRVQKAVNMAIEPLKQIISKPVIDTIIDSFTDNPDKKQLIKFHYENSIKHTGTTPEAIKEDLENALLIADKKALAKKVKELSLSVANRSTISNNSQGSNSKADFKKEILSDEQIQTLRKRGWDDAKINAFKENLSKKK